MISAIATCHQSCTSQLTSLASTTSLKMWPPLTSDQTLSSGMPHLSDLLELTVPFETNISHAAKRKIDRYKELKSACSSTHRASIITLEVGSRGFLNMEGFQQLYKLLRVKARTKQLFEITVIKEVITCSHIIWCQRNFNHC